MDTVQNANPTIRDVSDLPTRQDKSSEGNYLEDDSIFADLDKPLDSLIDPFARYAPSTAAASSANSSDAGEDDDAAGYYEPIDEQEIYDLIATISDPEHPLTLGSLSVVNLADIRLEPLGSSSGLTVCTVEITPTITHCSLATVIGLGVRVRLEQSLPRRFRVDVRVKDGTHSTGDQVNKQLGDKERVAAALENAQLMDVIMNMMKTCK